MSVAKQRPPGDKDPDCIATRTAWNQRNGKSC